MRQGIHLSGEVVQWTVYRQCTSKRAEKCVTLPVLHRRKDILGVDADQHNTDRWEGRQSGWKYIPFNGGPRICLGQQFGLIEVGDVVAQMVQNSDELDSYDSNTQSFINTASLQLR
jgi:cytochrome P450